MHPTPSAISAPLPLDLATSIDLANSGAATQDGTQETAQEPAGTIGEETQAPSSPGVFGGMMIPMLVIFGIFYFVMIGPERKARKKREAMLAEMKKGDQVVTSSGLHGTIANLAEDVVTLQVDEGVRLRFSRSAIQTIVPKDA
jgi:preprotein translocase subunit YajC